ncbi:MAG: sulfide/dihydroorotate dehydrogenase-like FAD/NAD-binding protein [Candidatus Omnitrophota bacterium]
MKIVSKNILGEYQGVRIVRVGIKNQLIAESARPGQFVMIMADKHGERIPLTVVESDKRQGIVSLIFQEVGLTTCLLGKLEPEDSVYALVGPLGQPTEIKNYGRIILVGGGVGIAEIYPVGKALKQAGNKIITVIGARTDNLLILREELKAVSDEIHFVTDDASCGRRGFTTDILTDLLSRKKYDFVFAVGPIVMMRKVAQITERLKITTLVSLNALMVDGSGMCGSCRITLDGKTKFACVDGPEFNAHLIDWDELLNRSKMYVEKERHVCKLYKVNG